MESRAQHAVPRTLPPTTGPWWTRDETPLKIRLTNQATGRVARIRYRVFRQPGSALDHEKHPQDTVTIQHAISSAEEIRVSTRTENGHDKRQFLFLMRFCRDKKQDFATNRSRVAYASYGIFPNCESRLGVGRFAAYGTTGASKSARRVGIIHDPFIDKRPGCRCRPVLVPLALMLVC